MNFEQLTLLVKKQKETSDIDPQSFPYEIRGSKSMQKEQARVQHQQSFQELKTKTLGGRLVGMFATGDTEAVERWTNRNYGICLDCNLVYRNFAEKIEKYFDQNRSFNVLQFVHFRDLFESFLKTENISIPGDDIKYTMGTLKDVRESTKHIKGMIEAAFGQSFFFEVAVGHIIKSLFDKEIYSDTVLVMLTDFDDDQAGSLVPIFRKHFSYNFTKKFVPSSLSMMKLIKKKCDTSSEHQDEGDLEVVDTNTNEDS